MIGSSSAARTAWGILTLVASQALAAPLSLTQAVEEAKANGFDAQVAKSNVDAARGDLEAARALPNPTLSVAAGPALGCFGDCRAAGPAITASLSEQGALWQLLVGKRALKEAAAKAGLSAVELTRVDVVRQLVAAVKTQFIAAVVAERGIAFSREVRDSSAKTAELTRDRYRAGAVDEADVSRVETQRLEAEQALDASLQNAAQQRSALRFLLGRRPEAADALELDAQPYLPARSVGSLEHATLEQLVAAALEQRPDVRSELAQVAQQEAALASVKRQRVPDLALTAAYSQQGLDPSYSSPPNVTFGLALPLPVAYRLEGEVAHAEAALASERVQLEKAKATVRSDVEQAWVAYQTALGQLRRMDEQLLRSAARARELVSVQYDKGAASLIEFLDAQRTFVAINVEYLTVVQSYWTAVFRLEAALGQELTP